MNVFGRFCVLVILTTVSKEASGEGESIGSLEIKFLRSTVNSVVLEAICKPSCTENVTWDIKFGEDGAWEEHPAAQVLRTQNTHQLVGLDAGRQYHIRSRSRLSSSILKVNTCPGGPPGVRNLHSGTNGPGWLDIRWTPLGKPPCTAIYEYLVRFRVGNGPFTSYRSYGYYAIDDTGRLEIGPSHPCSKWPRQFCVMITEQVVAGYNHTVEVVAKWMSGTDDELLSSTPQMISTFADDLNEQGFGDTGMHRECFIWACVSVGWSLFAIAVIASVLVSSVVYNIRRTNAYDREHGPPEGPFDFMEYLYST